MVEYIRLEPPQASEWAGSTRLLETRFVFRGRGDMAFHPPLRRTRCDDHAIDRRTIGVDSDRFDALLVIRRCRRRARILL